MRRLRRSLDIGLPAVGTVLVFGAVVLVYNLTMQIVLVLLGLVLIDAGIWKLTAPFLPNERRYNGLRAEVKRFLVLVRHLNDATLNLKEADTPASRVALQDAINSLHDSVGKIELLAGKTDAELQSVNANAKS